MEARDEYSFVLWWLSESAVLMISVLVYKSYHAVVIQCFSRHYVCVSPSSCIVTPRVVQMQHAIHVSIRLLSVVILSI